MKYSVIRKLFTFQYVSINTLDPSSTDNIQRVFTFQYVSINTRKRLGNLKNRGVDLHSNMFLLIPHRPHYHLIVFDIYIPICFY